jgi:hypothetical protein
MSKRLVAEVCAHHSVEDFRPYKIYFKDKGSHNANLVHAICAAIKKEADWNGWFCEFEFATPKQIKALVSDLIERTSKEGRLVKGAITCRSKEFQDLYGNGAIGLSVFVDIKDNNFGFLTHVSHVVDVSDEEFSEYWDKYETKWVSLV